MGKIMVKVAHLTSVHPRDDIRILLKECRSLVSFGFHVSLVVADGKGNETIEGIEIFDVGASGGRINRIFKMTALVLDQARRLDADIYHVHDPELIPAALKLVKLGKKVIFDAHEDLPKQLLGKPYLNSFSAKILSKLFSIYESMVAGRLTGIVTATSSIRDKFSKFNQETVDINNYPLVGELAFENIDWSQKRNEVCYVGGITGIRGILMVVESLQYLQTNCRLQLAGRFSSKELELKAKANEGWQSVDAYGHLRRKEVRELLGRSVAGVVTFLPAPNHVDAQPNKMFEYMSAGLPVIASNFPLWKEIIEGNNCGLCVDPLDPRAIADAIDYLVAHPAEAAQMGRNGQLAVQNRYNWGLEETKLYNFYERVLNA